MIGSDLYSSNCAAVLLVPSYLYLWLVLVFPPLTCFALSYGVQQATIWTVNVLPVTAKLFCTLPALGFLNHEHYYHYR